MRIINISDTHSLQGLMKYNIFDCIDKNQDNILIHAGDISNMGQEGDVSSFVNWFQNLKGFDTKIFIAGNHDLSFERKPDWLNQYINDENLSQSDCVYLEDSEFIIETPEFSKPIKFYGSPWQPRFFDWAFNVDRNDIHVHWDKIPDDTDVLITHGPPEGIRDFVMCHGVAEGKGCASLRARVDQIKPCLHVFGHLHGAAGAAVVNDIMFVNASICNEKYKPVNKPIVIDINEINGKLIADYIEY